MNSAALSRYLGLRFRVTRQFRGWLGRLGLREPLRDHLVLAHLEEALDLCRDLFRQVLGCRAQHCAGAHMRIGPRGPAEDVPPDPRGIGVFLECLIDVAGRIVRSGRKELALELEERGYDWTREEAHDLAAT